MRVTKGTVWWDDVAGSRPGRRGRRGLQGDRGSPDTTRSREIRPFQVWLMPAGKVNECNCAGTPFSVLPLLRLLFFFFALSLSRFRLSLFPLSRYRRPLTLRHSRVRQSLLTYRYTHGYDTCSDRISKVRVSHERSRAREGGGGRGY